MRSTYRFGLPAALLVLAGAAGGTFAQTTPVGPGGNQIFSVGGASGQPSNATYGSAYSTPYRAGFAVTPPPVPAYSPGFYGGYGWGNVYTGGFGNSAYGFMQGASSLLNSFGQYAMDVQQSRLVGQEVARSRIDTRRKQWDEWLYERATKPTENDERERTRMLELQRALGNPPESEIWSGQALNAVLDNIKRMQTPGAPTPFVPVDPDVLNRINIQGSGSEGNFGLLRNGGNLEFPFALQAPAFEQYRTNLTKLFRSAANSATVGPVPFDTINSLDSTLAELDETLSQQIRSSEISATRAIQARKYIKEMQQATRALQDPNVTQMAQKKFAPRGNSVSDLVTQMSQNGLRFSPSTRGDQPSYFALHKAMVDYNMALYRLVGREMAAQPAPMGATPRQ
jgi:hypothetical protein